jgi:poly(3-hydroxybutyrate) depolymerase
VATITSNYCIDSNRIFSTGHSMGAIFTAGGSKIPVTAMA